jgi:D-amino-acid dehydrogenase
VDNYNVIVVGAGIVGLAIADELAGRGASVLLLERNPECAREASWGNAGIVTPSHCIPTANVGNLKSAARWTITRRGSFSLSVSVGTAILPWTAAFLMSTRPKRVVAGARILHQLASRSLDKYEAIDRLDPELNLTRAGWLQVFDTRHGRLVLERQARFLQPVGVRVEFIGPEDLAALEPMAQGQCIQGAAFLPDDCHLDPSDAALHFLRSARERRAQVATAATVTAIRPTAAGVYVTVNGDAVCRGDTAILAAGVSTRELVRMLGLSLPLLPGIGHSITLHGVPVLPLHPLMLAEEHVTLTPMRDSLRITGGLDIASPGQSPSRSRLEQIRRGVARYLPSLRLDGGIDWHGSRPMSPDGLPIIGRLQRFPNVVVATGHGTLGVTLAPITADLVRQSIENGVREPELRLLSPARFGI